MLDSTTVGQSDQAASNDDEVVTPGQSVARSAIRDPRIVGEEPDEATMLGWAESLCPDQEGLQYEVRAIRPGTPPRVKLFPASPEGRRGMVRMARTESKAGFNCYFTLNPLIGIATKSANRENIAKRINILIDVDPIKSNSKASATNEEKRGAVLLGLRIKEWLANHGVCSVFHGDSGNGVHLIIRCDLPNDEASEKLVMRLLNGLGDLFDDERAQVDCSIYDSPRICKFYGTLARKGEATLERPHRYSKILDVPGGLPPLTYDEIESLVETLEERVAIQERAAPSNDEGQEQEADVIAESQSRGIWARATGSTREERAANYLAKIEPGIQGQNGSRFMFRACCAMVRMGLDKETAYRLVRQHYGPRCVPPWDDETEVWHKIDDAFEKEMRRDMVDLPDTCRSASIDPRAPADELDARLAQRPRTDTGNAERLVGRHGFEIRYISKFKDFFAYDGTRWVQDEYGRVTQLAIRAVRKMLAEASTLDDPNERKALLAHAFASESRNRIESMKAIAGALDGMRVVPEDLDKDKWLFNTQSGTIDLRDGSLRPHRREDLITQIAPHKYNPQASCPLWKQTLDLFFKSDAELIAYFQRLCGAAMSGEIQDHILPIAYGDGSNGKSTILGTLIYVFGTYAMKAPPDLLMERRNESHPTERADLFRKRLVIAIESDQGRRFNESLIKELTGNDRIRARKLYQDHFEFEPTHTIILATNHKPQVLGVDHGIWRRIKLLPFLHRVNPGNDDRTMPTKLRSEAPGILAWCVEGCLEWQWQGLNEPQCVIDATAEYRRSQDVVGAFLEENVQEMPGARIKSAVLYGKYAEFMRSSGFVPFSSKVLAEQLEQRGLKKTRSNGTWWLDVALTDQEEEHPDGKIMAYG